MDFTTAITEEFANLVRYVRGPKGQKVTALSSPKKATAEHLIFVTEEKYLGEAKASRACACLVSEALLSKTTDWPEDRLIFSSPNVPLAMALISRRFFPINVNKVPFEEDQIHPSAVIHPTAEIGKNCIIGPNATIGARCKIGANTIIGANTTIEPDAEVGEKCHIHPQVYIAYGTKMGSDCEVHPQTSIGTEGFGYAHDDKGNHYRQTHYGRVVIGNRVHIGAGVQIDRGTFEDSQIGDGTIIDNHCHFGHNIKIGKGTIITGGMITAGSVEIGSFCVFGGRTSIAGHLQIADGTQVAGLSGITKNLEKGAYGGYPPVPLKDSLKMYASLPQLPRLRKQMSQVLKKLGLDSEAE